MLKGDSMTIVAVISTPEKNGNTEAVVNKIAESAKANGQDVKTFYLNPMTNRKGCQACFACKAKGRCVQNDDLTPVLDAIREADGIILSTPVYFGEACGQYRLLEDRFFGFLDGSFNLNMPAGKDDAFPFRGDLFLHQDFRAAANHAHVGEDHALRNVHFPIPLSLSQK